MKIFIKPILYTAILLMSLNAFADDENENPDETPGDPGAVPIGDYSPLLILGGATLGFYFLKTKDAPVQ